MYQPGVFESPAVRKGGFYFARKRGGDVANEENLIPFNERTESEQREIAKQGGIASGRARRRRRSMKEAADYYLSLPETDRRTVNRLLRDAIDPEDIDNQMAVVVGIAEQAKRGDARAASVLLKLLGEDAPQEDAAADQLAEARKILGGVDSAID
jgi:hypothetical protein